MLCMAGVRFNANFTILPNPADVHLLYGNFSATYDHMEQILKYTVVFQR